MPFFEQASNVAGKVDSVFLFIAVLCSVFLVFITSLMIFFVIKYNRKKRPAGKDIEGNTWLEIAWTLIPLILFMAMFFYGWTDFNYMRKAPRDAMVITATARQWVWSFRYPNGKQTTELILALDKPVKVELRSLDVIHGFFVPAFRVKEDVVPGKNNFTWFTPTRLGVFDIQCTVICGAGHAEMLAKANVVPLAEFQSWYFSDQESLPPGKAAASAQASPAVQKPAAAILEQKACLTCHSLDGKVMVGPTFKNLCGRRGVVIVDGKEQSVECNDAYLTRAIQAPLAEIVKGYPPTMPSNPLNADELKQVIDLIKSLQ
jgi:cytochrome c oxidase subunit II